jgi:hypothetical protein
MARAVCDQHRAARVSDAAAGRLNLAKLSVCHRKQHSPASLVMLPPSKRPATTQGPSRPFDHSKIEFTLSGRV